MAVQRYIFGSGLMTSAVFAAVSVQSVQAAPLTDFQYSPETSQLTLVLPEGVEPRYFLMAQPARIVLDIPDTQIGKLPAQQRFSGAVKRIEVSQVQPQLARVILEMSPDAVFARGQVSLQNVGDASPGNDRWVLQPLLAKPVASKSSSSVAKPIASKRLSAPPVEAEAQSPKAVVPSSDSEKALSIAAPASPVSTAPPVPLAVPAPNVATDSIPSRSALPPMTPPSPIAIEPAKPTTKPVPVKRMARVTAKPVPPVELPPGMAAVIGDAVLPPLPNTPVRDQAIDSSSTSTSKSKRMASVPAPSDPPPLPDLSASIPQAAQSEASPKSVIVRRPTPVTVPTEASNNQVVAPAGLSVPLARLPQSSTSVGNVPPPPPLLQAAIINPVPAASTTSTAPPRTMVKPNSPAESVRPRPVVRADLLPPTPATKPTRPLVSVPPLASISVPTEAPVSRSSLPVTTPEAAVAAPALSSDLPPLPPTSPRDALPSSLPVTLPTVSSLPTGSLPAVVPSAVRSSPQVIPTNTQATTRVLEFGQPLSGSAVVSPVTPRFPNASIASLNRTPIGPSIVALDNLSTGGVVVPAGTTISLQYAQRDALKLRPGQRQQSLLQLRSPIVDARGRVIVAQGSVVLGEFATNQTGSQLTTKVLSIADRSLPFQAQSGLLRSSRRISNDRLLQNSGIGAVAGAILGGLNGSVLGGAAAGAAITYAVSPKQTMVEPGQVLQVQLLNELTIR